MIEIGKYYNLIVKKLTSKVIYLEHKDGTVVLLPGQFYDMDLSAKTSVKVFIISCLDGQFYGTTFTPKSLVNEFAFLRVKSVDRNNAFLDWGLPNFFIPVPQPEQRIEMKTGFSYLVYVYLDEKENCIKASSKITKFFDDKKTDLRTGEKVNLLVYDKTEIGVKVVVENKYRGLIYSNELFKNLSYGDKLTGYVKAIREDNKIDISM